MLGVKGLCRAHHQRGRKLATDFLPLADAMPGQDGRTGSLNKKAGMKRYIGIEWHDSWGY